MEYLIAACLLGVAVLILIVTILVEKFKSRLRDAEREKVEKELKDSVKPLSTLFDRYLATSDHTPEETRAAWAKCNEILCDLGINKYQNSVFHVFSQVRHFLMCNINHIDAAVRERMKEYYHPLVNNLWEFYYQIAFTYDLTPDNQNDLLRYLTSCFRYDSSWDDFKRTNAPTDFEWERWDARCLQLLEEGVRKGSHVGTRNMAECYYEKKIVPLRDYDKAFELYQRAAKLGDMYSVYMVGQCYEYGRGTKRNYQKAGDCYRFAYDATQDSAYAAALDELYTAQKWDKNRYSPDIFAPDTNVMKKNNLEDLRGEVTRLFCIDLEDADPKVVAVSIRMILEKVVNSFTECYEPASMNLNLSDKINLLRNKGHFTRDIADLAHKIRKLGNRGAHNDEGDPIRIEEVQAAVQSIEEFVNYYAQY